MSKPIVSISVPQEKQDLFRSALPVILSAAGTNKPMKLSKLVQEVVLKGVVYNSYSLQEFASKESLTNRDKYLIVILG